ncbi:MAG: DKNYY domain-containing protein [Paracoccus sp. (in: a-proteobacteria)]|uniref:DKNYY domain-containing protein n=1 Tax=Paracoccus sp. TaxID=267 RepID=UPI0026DFC6AE|nr:DKNYY domain-containing protein [Paracoccus sp. (in: a-proteobacteria)]MDO5632393.1 DKNYY domain-containing protein [Paracoccus sp. (in: a-proteobacteria)]
MSRPVRHHTYGRKLRLAIGLTLAAAAVLLLIRPEPPASPDVLQSENSTGYQIENGIVVWRPMSPGSQIVATILTLGLAANSEVVAGRSLPLADAASFRTLEHQYGRDNDHVWFRAEQIEGADPASFVVLDHGFSRDRTHIWHQATPVMALETAQQDNVRAHSQRILSVGTQTWLISTPPLLLPEAPAAPPDHYCRDWFTMNGALWRGASRMLLLDGPTEALDCDGGIRTVYRNGQPFEDITDNKGLLLRDGADIWRLHLEGPPQLIAILPEPVTEARLMRGRHDDEPVLLALTESGTVHAMRTQPQAQVQTLGRLGALPTAEEMTLDRGFQLRGRYFTLTAQPGPDDAVIADHGPAERFGDYALAGGRLFYGAEIVAHPKDLPLRQITSSMVLVGPSCLNFGYFVTDLADPAGEVDQIMALCDTMHPRTELLYDGLRIGFSPQLASLGPDTEHPRSNLFQLGEVFIENIGERDRGLARPFLTGFDLRVMGTKIEPPSESQPVQGVRLQPGQRHAWRPVASTDGNPWIWPWVLTMRHSPERAEIFGDRPFDVSHGGFGSWNE